VNLAAVPTQAHLLVRSSGIDSLRVLVDGVDVGATPWEGNVAPGPHQISGRSSKAAAPAQPIDVAAGSQTAVDLAPASTAAHLVLHTSDGKGLITVDAVAAGEGAYSGDVTSGEHTFSVTRDGYKPATKTVTLGANETWAETVTLEPITVSVTTTTSGERPRRNSSRSRAAMEVKGMRSSSTRSISGLPRESALPTTTRSGAGERFASA